MIGKDIPVLRLEMREKMKRIVIVGATSGIGLEVAKLYMAKGWKVGVAGRNVSVLEWLKASNSESVETQVLDVCREDAAQRLNGLVKKLGGMDVYLHCAGIGKQNMDLEESIEAGTVQTNVAGFVRMVMAVFHFFEKQGSGHIAVISSIAGTKGLGAAPSYSATKCFQNSYMEALEQQIRMRGLDIRVTDIRPGFVDTPLLQGGTYPALMRPEKVAKTIVRAIDRKKSVAVIDWKYRILVFFWRMIPRYLWVRMNIRTR